MPDTARRIVLASRPVGEPKTSDFHLEEFVVQQPKPGQILLRTKWLSLDPYMRGRMSDAPSYAKPVGINEVMEGGTVCEVVASNHPNYRPGEIVLAHSGWQTHALSDGANLRKLDPQRAPVSTALGVLGMPGMTAYISLTGRTIASSGFSPNSRRARRCRSRSQHWSSASSADRSRSRSSWLLSSPVASWLRSSCSVWISSSM